MQHQLCNEIIEEAAHRGPGDGPDGSRVPQQIYDHLQEYVIGQDPPAVLAVAVHNRMTSASAPGSPGTLAIAGAGRGTRGDRGGGEVDTPPPGPHGLGARPTSRSRWPRSWTRRSRSRTPRP
ncbi:hypothetical protein QJS66_01530 [Kocuria rhizophila]|nr:hypothetical protein QJS66_01530 [Kocuria rhizophila]